jgi:hypothetical protein
VLKVGLLQVITIPQIFLSHFVFCVPRPINFEMTQKIEVMSDYFNTLETYSGNYSRIYINTLLRIYEYIPF